MRCTVLVLAVAAAVVAPSCGDDGEADTADGKPTVLTSFYPLAEVARKIGGDALEIANLTPSGTEPHDLELNTDQVDQLQDADLVVYLGGGFQPAVEDAVSGSDRPTLDLLEAVPVEQGADEEVDPHFWLDPTLLARAVDEVESALTELVPASAEALTDGAEAYRAELAELDREIGDRLSECERRDVVTSHAAFHYLAERYGLRQRPIAGLSPEAEPDPQRLAELADFVEDNGVTTIFSETLVSPEVAEALAREVDVDTAVLNPIEGLTDEQVDAGDTYASVMRENAAALEEALGCG